MVDSAFATDDALRAQLAAWQRELGSVRRLAANTLEAYARDVDQFLSFLAGHAGGPVTLATLRELRGADIRAFMAQRRNESLGSRSLIVGGTALALIHEQRRHTALLLARLDALTAAVRGDASSTGVDALPAPRERRGDGTAILREGVPTG